MVSFLKQKKIKIDNEVAFQEFKKSNASFLESVRNYYHDYNLSPFQKLKLENKLLAQKLPVKYSWLESILNFPKQIIFTHVLTAILAIILTWNISLILNEKSVPSEHDILSEVVSLSEMLKFPADFNLAGNFNNLPDFIRSSLQNSAFLPIIPQQISEKYLAYEGRFFLYQGDQGVGINLLPTISHDLNIPLRMHQGFAQKHHSTFYIVKLSPKSQSFFPTHKLNKRVLSSNGNAKRVFAWREGTYGYAMVQPD